MQVHRIIAKVVALAALALALAVGTAAVTPTVAGAQTDGYEGYDGYDGYDGYEGYDGYDGYEGGDDDTTTEPDETAAPAPSPTTGGTLPRTGGVAVLGLAGAAAVAGLSLRRLVHS